MNGCVWILDFEVGRFHPAVVTRGMPFAPVFVPNLCVGEFQTNITWQDIDSQGTRITEWESRACPGRDLQGERSVRILSSGENQFSPVSLKTVVVCLTGAEWLSEWKPIAIFSSGYSVIMQEWRSSAKVTNYYVNYVVFLDWLGKPGWVTGAGGRTNCSRYTLAWELLPKHRVTLCQACLHSYWLSQSAIGKAARRASQPALGNVAMRRGELGFAWSVGRLRSNAHPAAVGQVTNRSCRGAPWHCSRMEIRGVKGFRPGWTYSRRELDKKEEEWERREGKNDSVGKTLQIMCFPSLLEIWEGVRQQCLLRRGTTLPALFVISHTPMGLGSSTAVSPACWQIRLCGSFLIHQGWPLCSLHFPCPHSNGQINFLVSLDTIFALGRKFSCIAKPVAA